MARPISLLIGLCALSCLGQGRTLKERGVNRYFQRHPISQTGDYPAKDDSIPTIILLEEKDAILDALLAANKEELAKREGSRTATEFLPGLGGVYRSDRSNGERMVYMSPIKFGDKKADKNLRIFGWWFNWWKGLHGSMNSASFGPPNNIVSPKSQHKRYNQPVVKL